MNYSFFKKNKLNKAKVSSQKGFTLIEMLVAVGLFSVVMLVAVSAILSIIGNNKKAQGINNVVNNLNFAIESMVRDMKTGYLYRCDTWPIPSSPNDTSGLCPPSSDPYTRVSFFSTISGVPEPVEYKFVEPATGGDGQYVPGHIVKITGAGGNEIDLTSKTDVDIKSVKMFVHSPRPASEMAPGETPSQPGIFLIIKGEANILGNEVTEFGLQTFISQRVLNL